MPTIEPLIEISPPFWDYETEGRVFKSCAVVALDMEGHTSVLDHFGPAIDWHADQFSSSAEELGLEMDDEYPPGVYVWEGSMGSVQVETRDGMEWDHEVNGVFREPTQDEWLAIQKRECPWDKENCPRWEPGKFYKDPFR